MFPVRDGRIADAQRMQAHGQQRVLLRRQAPAIRDQHLIAPQGAVHLPAVQLLGGPLTPRQDDVGIVPADLLGHRNSAIQRSLPPRPAASDGSGIFLRGKVPVPHWQHRPAAAACRWPAR